MPMVTRHFLLMDQVIEDDRHPPAALLVNVSTAVLEYHHASRRVSLVLFGHIDPVIPDGAEKNRTGPSVFGDLTPRYIRLNLGIWAELVIVRPVYQRRQGEKKIK